MKGWWQGLWRYWRQERGLQTIELVVLGALIVVGLYSVWKGLGTSLKGRIMNIQNTVNSSGTGL